MFEWEELRMSRKDRRHQWGRSRFGGIPTMRIAIPAGVVIAFAYGIAYAWVNSPDDRLRWIVGLVHGAIMTPVLIAFVAVLITDRSTMRGAVRNPEASVESVWYDKAASATFHWTLAGCGVGIPVAIWLNQVLVSQVLTVVASLMAISFVVIYLAQKLRS